MSRLVCAWLAKREEALKGLVRGEVASIDYFDYAQLDFTKGDLWSFVPLVA
jgi:sigma54-dependent transcription regulator